MLIPANDTSRRAGTSALQCHYIKICRVAGHVPTRLAATPGGPAHEERSSPARRPRPIQRTVGGAGAFAMVPQRVGARLLHGLRRALPPTIFFFVGCNCIVLTTYLLVADSAAAVSNFMLATLAALVVGKAVITANAIPFITRFDRAPSSNRSCSRRPCIGSRCCLRAWRSASCTSRSSTAIGRPISRHI